MIYKDAGSGEEGVGRETNPLQRSLELRPQLVGGNIEEQRPRRRCSQQPAKRRNHPHIRDGRESANTQRIPS